MIERKLINSSESDNYIIECDSSLSTDVVLNEAKKSINKDGENYFSQEFFFFDSSEISIDNILELEEIKYTKQFYIFFVHNENELNRLLLSNIIYSELQEKNIFFIFIIPSMEFDSVKESIIYNDFQHIYIEGEEDVIEEIEIFTKHSPIRKLEGFDMFEKSGFAKLSDHFKYEFIMTNNYNKETISKLAFFGIISNDLKELMFKKISSDESFVDKVSRYLSKGKVYLATIF